MWHFGFETFPNFLMVLVSVSKNFGIKKVSVSKFFGIDKSIGTCFGKKLVSKKVSDSVSKKFGIGKKFWIRFRSDFGFRHTLANILIHQSPMGHFWIQSLIIISVICRAEERCPWAWGRGQLKCWDKFQIWLQVLFSGSAPRPSQTRTHKQKIS